MLTTTNSFYLIKCNNRKFNAEDENVYDDKKPNTMMTFNNKKAQLITCEQQYYLALLASFVRSQAQVIKF